jgi:hypothetical protein
LVRGAPNPTSSVFPKLPQLRQKPGAGIACELED